MAVYFISMSSRLIKIGFTEGGPLKRMAQLQTGNPQKLTLIGTIPGGRNAEVGLHGELAQFRREGEWFAIGEKSAPRLAIDDLIRTQSSWEMVRAWRMYQRRFDAVSQKGNLFLSMQKVLIERSLQKECRKKYDPPINAADDKIISAGCSDIRAEKHTKLISHIEAHREKNGGDLPPWTPKWVRERYSAEAVSQ